MTTAIQLKSTVQPFFRSGIQFYDFHPPLEDFKSEILRGLRKPQKAISPQFLYDQQGAVLFDAICTLEEYYITRTEVAILKSYAAEIAEMIGDGVLVEFGSGSSQKVRVLLDAAPQINTYVALDISRQHLYESCTNLVSAYPKLRAIALCTDYTKSFPLPQIRSLKRQRKIGFFPGSSIGNLEPEEAVNFLKNAASLLQPNGGLIVGIDLKKDKAILEPAYDDAKGISAAFALNLLTRINRELGANFNLNNFGYRAVYNSKLGRIEMYIVSLVHQVVALENEEITFSQGETLRTEYSYKYSISEFQDLAAMAGFQPVRAWVDPQQLFSIHYLQLS